MSRILIFILAVALSATTTRGDLIFRVAPELTEWVANGVTEYRVDILLNSTAPDVIDKDIRAGGYALAIPNQIIFAWSTMPDPNNNDNPGAVSTNPDDIWFGYLMDAALNRVNHGAGPGGIPGWELILGDNVRSVDTNIGPSNLDDKIFGTYYFVVPVGAQLGETNFLTAAVIFSDTSEFQYNKNTGLTIDNQPFTIVGCRTVPADLDGDDDVDSADLAQLLGSWGPCECPADLDGDGDVDAADLAQLLGSWGPCS